MTFEVAVEFILEHEGGYSNDSQDPGGETNFGISKRSYPDVDIKNLTREDACAIYERDYWTKMHCAELPDGLDLLVFDSAVNQGVGAATKMLQQAVGTTVDGVIGPKTIQAANDLAAEVVKTEFLARRMNQYAQNPNVSRYGLGWFRRVAAAAEEAF